MQHAYSQIYKYVMNTAATINDLHAIVQNIGQDVYVQALTARSNVLCGHIPFYAVIFKPDKFMDIMTVLDKKHWVTVLSEMEDGNTCLTEALIWNITDVVKNLLATVKTEKPVLYEQILDTQNHTRATLRELLAHP